jgi:hypothetical protein
MSSSDTLCLPIPAPDVISGGKPKPDLVLASVLLLRLTDRTAAEVTMWNWFTCHVSARHEYGVSCERGAIFLRCIHCGRRSSGWSVDAGRTAPRLAQARAERRADEARTAVIRTPKPVPGEPTGPAMNAAETLARGADVRRFEPPARSASRAATARNPVVAVAPAVPARILAFPPRAPRERPAA